MEAEFFQALPRGGVGAQDPNLTSLITPGESPRTNSSQKSINPQNIIRSQFGDLLNTRGTGATLGYLSRETDPRLFWHGLLGFAQNLERQEDYPLAARVYELLSKDVGARFIAPWADQSAHYNVPTDVQEKARQRLDAMAGRGDPGRRFEFMGRGFVKGAADPALLFAFGAVGLAYKGIRLHTLSKLLARPAGILTRGPGASLLASLTGFVFEAPLFPAAHKLGSEVLGRKVDWSWGTTRREIASSFLVLGGLKAMGGLSRGLFHRVHGISGPAGQAVRLPHLARVTAPLAPQVGMLSGIMLGHRTEEWAGLRKPLDGATTLVDSMMTLFQLNTAGALLRRGAPQIHQWEARLENEYQQTRDQFPFFRPGLGTPLRTPSLATGHLGNPGSRNSLPGQVIPEGMSAMLLGETPSIKTRRRPTTLTSSLDKDIEAAVTHKIQGLADLPKIRRALLPQTVHQMANYKGLEKVFKDYRANLRKLDETIGDSTVPGAAPFVARLLNRRLMKGKGPDFKLHEHPIARMVAAGLITHYEALEDLIGNQIYRDLNTVFRILQNPSEKNLTWAEDILLQNLELDPFNPWLIQTGRWVSLKLGKFAKEKPKYYEALLKTMEERPNKWRKHNITRGLEEEIIGKFRKKLLKTSSSVSEFLGIMINALEPLVKFILGIIPTPTNIIKGALYFFKMSHGASQAPKLLEGMKRRTEFEINLYYGNYRQAVFAAEPSSKLPTIWEVLTRERMGKRLEEKVYLETIPQLPPHAVNQRGALAELEKKLSQTQVLNLEGIDGSTKTTLAVQLAHHYQNQGEIPVFWYTLREEKTSSRHRILHHLAHFLETHDPVAEQGLLSRILEQKTLTKKSELIRAALRRNPSLLIMDKFHSVSENPESLAFFTTLFKPDLLDTKIVTITQRSNEWLNRIGALNWRSGGLTTREAEALLENLGISKRLDSSQREQILELTGQMPQSLILLSRRLKVISPAEIPGLIEAIAQKIGKFEVLKFLFHEVYDDLSPKQQQLLKFLILFRDPVPKEAIYFVGQKETNGFDHDLIRLKEDFLVEERRPGILEIHPTFQILLKPRMGEVEELHRRAAEFIRAQTKYPSDYMEAAYHYFEAGEHDRAIRMLSRSTTYILRSGYRRRVEELLEKFTPEIKLSADERAELNLAKGSLAHFRKQLPEALDFFRAGLKTKRRLQDPDGISLFYYKLGKVYDTLGSYRRSLTNFRKSLEIRQRNRDLHGMYYTLRRIGQLHKQEGYLNEAWLSFRKALSVQELLQDPYEKGRANYELGKLARLQGMEVEAEQYLAVALEIFQALGAKETKAVQRILEEIRGE